MITIIAGTVEHARCVCVLVNCQQEYVCMLQNLKNKIFLFLQALCRITKHNVSIFQSVIDKVGLSHILDALVVGINRVQQAIVTMFAQLIASGAHLSRLMQDKVSSTHITTIH